jgi:hypothetical protein
MKVIDLEKSVYELTEEYPELIEILREMGFIGVINPLVRKTLGKKTTIPQGAKKQGRDMEEIIEKLRDSEFEILE